MPDLTERVNERVAADRLHYERYGKPLEASHRGEYIAIGPAGRTIVGASDVGVLEQAINSSGSGNFALRGIGRRSIGHL